MVTMVAAKALWLLVGLIAALLVGPLAFKHDAWFSEDKRATRMVAFFAVVLGLIATYATFVVYADGIIYQTDTYCTFYWFDIFTCWPF